MKPYIVRYWGHYIKGITKLYLRETKQYESLKVKRVKLNSSLY